VARLEWLEWWTAGRVVAAAAVAQLVVVGWAALYARGQVREARTLREEQARPFVVVDVEPERRPFMNLVVANLGRTMARNVRIEIDPPLQSTVYDSGGFGIARMKLFTEPIPSLAPGKRMVMLFDSLPARIEAGLPDSYEVRLSYEWDGGPIVDTQRLDLDLYRHQRLIWRDTIHHVSETLKKMDRRMDKWSAGYRGLLTLSLEEARRRDEEDIAELRAQGELPPEPRGGVVGRLLEVVRRLRRR
jgi:hypothetical protein